MIRHLPSVEELTYLYVLDSVKGFGPKKFKQCFEAKVSAKDIVEDPEKLPIRGKLGEPLRKQLKEEAGKRTDECKARAEKQLKVAESTQAWILTYASPQYPRSVYESNNAVPILYCRGNIEILSSAKTVACVGSRNIRDPYAKLQAAFAHEAAAATFTVVSGFALGADTIAHQAAFEANGSTVCVMPSGLDRPFPPENKGLWQRFLTSPHAVFVSEFAFGSGANSLNLKKRNKLIVAFAKGVVIAQSAADGGAMNAYRFAIEQKKPVATFRSDNTKETSGNDAIAGANDYRAQVFGDVAQPVEYQKWLRTLSS
jgi:DNA protecting protein DprA